MAKNKKEYPRTLYKSPGSRTLISAGVRYTYDSVDVSDEEEERIAKTELGYIDGFEEAIEGSSPVEEKEEEQEEAPDLPEGF